MTVFELAVARLEECGMTNDSAVACIERFGATTGKDIPWADIAPRLNSAQIEHIDRAGMGWKMRTEHCGAPEGPRAA